RRFVRDCNRVYRAHSALHARDCEPEGFAWAVVDDALASVFAWVRHAPAAPPVAVIANFTTQAHDHYRLPLPRDGVW
ncbi:alpha amylase C-terminal domain-containing protein, partial [Streptomyces galilaeus]